MCMNFGMKKRHLSKHDALMQLRKRDTKEAANDNVIIKEETVIQWKAEVTAADFNGKSFDGSPFLITPYSANSDFTQHIISGDIKIDRMTCTDYAIWLIKTEKGVERVGPGDIVTKRNDKLIVTYCQE